MYFLMKFVKKNEKNVEIDNFFRKFHANIKLDILEMSRFVNNLLVAY